MAHFSRTRWLWIVLVLVAGIGVTFLFRPSPSRRQSRSVDQNVTELVRQVASIEEKEAQITRSLWAPEKEAEDYGAVLEKLWDSLNSSTNKWEVLNAFDSGQMVLPALAAPKSLAHGIQVSEQSGPGITWLPTDWKGFLGGLRESGWEIVQTEFRHLRFDPSAPGHPAQSRYYFSAHLMNKSIVDRASLEGYLNIAWRPAPGSADGPSIQQITTEGVSLRRRSGAPPFRRVADEKVTPPEGSFFIDPLLLHDLDGDGLSEIILAAKNLVFHRRPDGQYESRPLCRYDPGLIFTAVIGDFDGDGAADFLCAKFDGLLLYQGSPKGTFDEPGRLVWSASPRLKYAQALTCGDIDHDGDLDLWLGQYKVPYARGQMPTPYHDANDGFPSHLLLNDGHGNFTDGTAAAGLITKRWRRAYSASFVDFNHDRHLDLVVASDFAGLELFANDGAGHFSDVTTRCLPEWQGFGMSQLAADFNRDGLLDLLMVGMNVPVADRLIHFGRGRPGFETYLARAPEMTYGNRLCFGQPSGEFKQTSMSAAVARSGWSWGCSALDFDNDGYPDLYIANGHETKQSVRDYETEFWLHDIYVGNSRDDLATFAYFQAKSARTRGQGMSYGGYEKNRLYWNQEGKDFVEIGFLMGVGLEPDSRNVVADDLDGDGRMDLLVTTFEVWPEVRQTLQIYRNELESAGNWIGIRVPDQKGLSSVGAEVTVEVDGVKVRQAIVAGDSYRSQRSQTLHFGLGKSASAATVEVQWLNGRTATFEHLEANRTHSVIP